MVGMVTNSVFLAIKNECNLILSYLVFISLDVVFLISTQLLLYLHNVSSSRTKPPKVDKDEDPGLGLMKLMKQMYDDGDDEMKRTIAKAWHESQEKRAKGTDDLP